MSITKEKPRAKEMLCRGQYDTSSQHHSMAETKRGLQRSSGPIHLLK